MKSISKYFFILVFFFLIFGFAHSAFAASRYWVGGAGTWDNSTTTHWSDTSGGAGGFSAPAIGVDVFFDGNSGGGAVTRTANGTMQSIDMLGFTGTLAWNNDGFISAPTGGGTYRARLRGVTFGLASLFALRVDGTSTLLYDSGGATGSYTISVNGGGNTGTVIFETNSTGASSVTLTAGTLKLDGASSNSGLTHSWGIFNSVNSNTRTLDLGNSSITLSNTSPWDTSTFGGLTVSANTSTVTFNANGANLKFGGVNWNGLSIVITGVASPTLNAPGSTFANVTRTGTAIKTDGFSIAGDFTVTGSLTLNGNAGAAGASVNRLFVASSALGTPRIVTVTGATVSANNVDLSDITFARADAGGLDLTAGGTHLVGDAQGNSRTGGDGTVTFTTSAPQYWVGNGGGTSDAANHWASTSGGTPGTGRTPLPQDDMIFNDAGITLNAQIITNDMPRMGRNMDWSGVTLHNPRPDTSVATQLYGSLTLSSALGGSMFQTQSLTFVGRATANMPVGGWTITSAGRGFSQVVQFSSFNGTYKLLDAFSVFASATFFFTGTFDANGFNYTFNTMRADFGGAMTINMGTLSQWNGTGTGTVWRVGSPTVINAQTSTLIISNATTTGKTFQSIGYTYNNASFTGDSITITGSNTWNGTFFIGKANKTTGLLLGAGTTQTFGPNGFITTDSDAGNKAKFLSNSGSVNAIVSKPSVGARISVNNLQLTRITATQTKTFYAGTGSVDNGNNTNWTFTNPPPRGLTIKNAKFKIKNSKVKLRIR